MNNANALSWWTDVQEPRKIAPRIWWLPVCQKAGVSGRETHVHNSPYVIIGEEKVLLYDTGLTRGWDTVSTFLDRLLGDRAVDYVVPSHSETPHSGNANRLLEKYPEAVVAGDVRDWHLYFPQHVDRLQTFQAGDVLDLGGEKFVFLEALLKDLVTTQWGYAVEGRVLFTADAFACMHHPPVEDEDRPVHRPGECALFASEFGYVPRSDQIAWIVVAAFYWARFKNVEELVPLFAAMVATYPTDLIAPAHGAVIDDMSVLPVIWKALSDAYDPTLMSPLPGLKLEAGLG